MIDGHCISGGGKTVEPEGQGVCCETGLPSLLWNELTEPGSVSGRGSSLNGCWTYSGDIVVILEERMAGAFYLSLILYCLWFAFSEVFRQSFQRC